MRPAQADSENRERNIVRDSLRDRLKVFQKIVPLAV